MFSLSKTWTRQCNFISMQPEIGNPRSMPRNFIQINSIPKKFLSQSLRKAPLHSSSSKPWKSCSLNFDSTVSANRDMCSFGLAAAILNFLNFLFSPISDNLHVGSIVRIYSSENTGSAFYIANLSCLQIEIGGNSDTLAAIWIAYMTVGFIWYSIKPERNAKLHPPAVQRLKLSF